MAEPKIDPTRVQALKRWLDNYKPEREEFLSATGFIEARAVHEAAQAELGALLVSGAEEPIAQSFRDARQDWERAYLRAVLRSVSWNMHRAAAILQMPRPNVYRKLGQLGIIKPEDPTHG